MTALAAFILGAVAGVLGYWAVDHQDELRAELQQARAELDAEVQKSKPKE